MPRELTTDEARKLFLDQVRRYVDYWEKESRAPLVREKLEGLAFGILVILDGGSGGLPSFAVIPTPHESDKAYCESIGANWFRPAPAELTGDIGGGLHEHFHDAKEGQ